MRSSCFLKGSKAGLSAFVFLAAQQHRSGGEGQAKACNY
jgi:hypothetical protein